MAGSNDVALLRRLMRQARPHWAKILGIFALDLLLTPLALLAPLPLMIAVDCVVGSDAVPGFIAALLPESLLGSDTAVLVFAAGLLVAIALLTRLVALGSSVLRAFTSELLEVGFRSGRGAVRINIRRRERARSGA